MSEVVVLCWARAWRLAFAVALGAAAAVALVACSADEAANPALKKCTRNADCMSGMCHRGYCYGEGMAGMDASPPGDGGATDAAGQDGGDDEDGGVEPPAPEPCEPADAGDEPVTAFCYTGVPEDTRLKGICKAGERTCFREEASPMGGFWGPCVDEIVPMEHELCNGVDDDCDDTTDEDMSLASCDTLMLGECREGRVICEMGSAICAVITTPAIEECDGDDNDCDGQTDEGNVAQASCYGSQPGCTDANGDGIYDCLGVCKAGVQQCMEGRMQACSGMVEPAAMEDCALNVDGIADDDDCDGQIDEDCSCTPTEQQLCYSGPDGTHANAPCQRGMQTCDGNGDWENDCAGEVVPGVESCANEGVDDDCDGTEDDVPMRGFACEDTQATGRCATGTFQCVSSALECVTPDAREETCDSTDDDCDGQIDDGFNLQNDEQNCGTCGMQCTAATPTCCDGTCVDTNTDEAHCGMCGKRCGSTLMCCGGQCVDTQNSAAHCGGCNMPCSALTGCCRGACPAVCL